MKRSAINALAWLASVAGAFIIGKLASSNSSSTKENEISNSTSAARLNPPRSIEHVSTKESEITDYTVLNKARVTTSEYRKDFGISKIVSTEDPIQRLAMLLSVIEQLQADDMEAVMTAFEELPNFNKYRFETSQLMHAWAQIDPEAALDFVTKLPRYRHGRFHSPSVTCSPIISVWASRDMNAALAWAKKNFEPKKSYRGMKQANPYMVGIIQGIVASDLHLATDMFMELPPQSSDKLTALYHISKHVASQGSENALAWVNSLENEHFKKRAFETIIDQISQNSPEELVDWFPNIEDAKMKQFAMSKLAKNWAIRDPKKAKEWINGLEGSQRTTMAAEVIRDFSYSDPNATSAWIDEMKGLEGYQNVLQSFIAVNGGSLLTFKQIANITDERKRNLYYERALSSFVRSDYPDLESTKNWLEAEGNQVPANIRKIMARHIRHLEINQN